MPKTPGENGGRRGTLDERLFRAWQAGDAAACVEIWELFHARVYTVAVKFCNAIVDAPTARQVATTAFGKAWQELELDEELEAEPGEKPSLARKGEKKEGRKKKKTKAAKMAIVWRGGPQLEKYVRNLVINRCRDALKPRWRWLNRLVGAEEPEEGTDADPLEDIVIIQPAQEEDLLRDARDRDGVRRVVRELAGLAETCRCRDDSPDSSLGDGTDRGALLEVVEAMRAYLRGCFVDAGRTARSTSIDGRDWAQLPLDELVDAVDPESVEATRKAMYHYIMETLALPNRNVLYTRIADIRALRDHQRDGGDTGPA